MKTDFESMASEPTLRKGDIKSAHRNFLRGRFNFSKSNQYPIAANLFQPLVKMHAIIVKQGFAVTVAFRYNIVYSET